MLLTRGRAPRRGSSHDSLRRPVARFDARKPEEHERDDVLRRPECSRANAPRPILSFGAITSSVALIPLNGQAFVAPRAGPGLVLVGSFVDDYLFFMSDSLTGLEVPEDGYPVTDMLYNVNKCEVSSDMCLTSVGCFQ